MIVLITSFNVKYILSPVQKKKDLSWVPNTDRRAEEVGTTSQRLPNKLR